MLYFFPHDSKCDHDVHVNKVLATSKGDITNISLLAHSNSPVSTWVPEKRLSSLHFIIAVDLSGNNNNYYRANINAAKTLNHVT